MKQVLSIAPGYKPIRSVYGFYAHKYGITKGILLAMLYPLPYSILFLMIYRDFQVPFLAIFALAGMRSGAIGIHIKYFLHFPKLIFQRIIFIFTIVIALLVPNSTSSLI